MNWIETALLGVIQGLTEFLPVSSSGHLVIMESLLVHLGLQPIKDTVAMNIALHLGTLVAILLVYWKRVFRLLGSDWRVIPLLIVGTLPAAVVGVTLKLTAEDLLKSPLLAGFMLPVTGAILLWSARQPVGEVYYEQMSYRQAMLIGVFQAFALLPGVSRSGATIAAGLFVGLRRDSAAAFSFLLAIPAILGAGVLELKDLDTQSAEQVMPLVFGGAISAAVGLVALLWLLKWLQSGRLQWFAYWCIPVGVAVVIWQLLELGAVSG